MSVNFNPDEKKFLLAQGTGSTVEVTQTDVAQESCFSNNGLSSNKVDLSQFENSSEWTPIQAQQNSKFLFFGNNGYTFKTSSGVEITIENPDDLGEAQIFENKETGEVFVINAKGAKIKSGGDNTSISIYNSQIDSVDTKKGDDTINVYDSTIDELNTGKGSDDVSIYNSLIESLETGAGSDIINVDDSSIDKVKSQKDFLWGLFGSSNDTINIENSDVENLKTGAGNDTVILNDSQVNGLKTKGGVDSVSLNNTQTTTSDLGKKDLKVENGNYLADFDVSKIPSVETDEVITLQSGEQINVGDYLALIPQQEVGFETEAEYQQYAIQAMADNLESMKTIFQTQNDKDGVMADGFSGLKELTGLGISGDDIENVIAEQEEIINQLTLAMQGQSDLTFEEAYEKYTGTKFSTEKIDKYMRTSNIASAINSACYYDKDYADKFEEATGKTIDEINQEFALCQNEVLGKSQSLQNLVEDYSASQEGFADKLSTIISASGMICIAVGAIVSFIPGGAAIGVPLMTAGKWVAFGGMLADNAIDLVDHSTDKDGLTGDEVKNLALETGIELVSYGAGRAIGYGTNALNSFITKEATKQGIGAVGSYILGQSAETVADTALSLGADYLIAQGQSLITTGELMDASDYWSVDRFLGEGKNQLMGILTGLSSSKVSAYSQGVIATAQTKIQAGDIEGAKSYLKQSGLGQYASGTKFNNLEASAKMPTIMPEVNAKIQAGDVEGAKQILSDNGLSNYNKGKNFTSIEQQAHISKAQELIASGDVEGAKQYLSDNGLEKYSTGDKFNSIQAQANAPEILSNAQRMILEGKEKEAQQYLKDEGLSDYATRDNFYQLTIQTKAPQVMAEVEKLILAGDEAGAKQYLADNGFKEYTNNEKFNTIIENIKTANTQASAVEAAKTMILEGDLDGARKLLEDSGLEVDDESFKALSDEILATKTENEVKKSQAEVKEDKNTDTETSSGRLKINLQFFAEKPKNIDTQKPLQERMDEAITIDKIATLTEGQKIDMLSDVGLTTEGAYKAVLSDNARFQRTIYLSKIVDPNGDSIDGHDITSLLSLSNEDFQRIEDLIVVENRLNQFTGRNLVRFSKLSDEELATVRELLYIPERGDKQFSATGLIDLAGLSPEELIEAKKLLYVEERGEQQFSASDIVSLSELSAEDFARAKTYFNMEGRNGQQFSGNEAILLSKLNEQEFSRAQQLFNIPERGDKQLSLGQITRITSELNDEQFVNAEKLLRIKNIDEQFSLSDIIDMSQKYSAEQLTRLEKISYIEGRENQFSSWDIKRIIGLNDEQFARAEQLLYIEGREKQFDIYDIERLAKLDDEQFARAQKLLYVEGREEQFSEFDIARSAEELNDEQFAIAQKLLFIEGREKQLSNFDIRLLAQEYDEQGLKNISHLLNVPERGDNQFGASEITSLAKLTPEEYEKAKTLFNISERGEQQFSGHGIAELAKLTPEEYEKAEKLFNVPEKGEQQFSGEDIVKLIKLNEQEMEKAKTLFNLPSRGDKQLDAYDIVQLAKLSDDEFEKAKTFVDLEGKDRQYSAYQIKDLIQSLDDKQFARAQNLLYIEGRQKQLDKYDIERLAKLDDEQFARAEQLLYIEGREKEFSILDIIEYATEYSEAEFARLEKILNIGGNATNISHFDLSDFTKDLSDAEFARAEQLFQYLKNQEGVSISGIAEIAKMCTDENFEQVTSLFEIPRAKNNQFKTYDVKALLELNDAEFARALNILNTPGRNDLSIYNIKEFVKYDEAKYALLEQILYIEGREKQLEVQEISAITGTVYDLDEKIAQNMAQIVQIKGTERLDIYGITEIAKNLDNSQIGRIEKLLDIPERGENQFDAYSIAKLAKLTDEQLIEAQKLYSIPEKGEQQYKGSEIAVLVSIDNPEEAISRLEAQKQKIYNNPDKYVNGEYESAEAMKKEIDGYFDVAGADFLQLASVYDKEALDNLFRMRFNDVGDYITTIREFNSDDFEILNKLSNSCNIDGKPFMPTQKIQFIDLIDGYKKCGLDYSKMETMLAEGKIDTAQLNIDLFNQIMKISGMTDEEIASIPKEKLTSWDTKYAHLLAKEINSGEDATFGDLLRAANLEDFETYIHDESNTYGQTNANTKVQYNEMGMDYDKWLHPSKENEVQFLSKDKNTEQLTQIASQIQEDINTLMQTPAKGFIRKQFAKFVKGDEFIIPNEYLTSKAKLTELVKMLSDTSDQGQMSGLWKRAQGNLTNADPNRVNTARNTLTVLDHLNQRMDDISKVQDSKVTKTLDLTIKMWDRNPQKDIFQGNYSTCCIGMGGGNGSAMPHFVMDTAYNMIELVDNTSGKTIGNALCYFAKDSNGEPIFIVDNIEISNSVKPSEEVGIELRDSITQYASNVAKEVTGQDDIPIYMSKQYNDVPFEDLPANQETISFMGDIDCEQIYMDLYGGWIEKEDLTHNCNLLKLK